MLPLLPCYDSAALLCETEHASLFHFRTEMEVYYIILIAVYYWIL
jgi:hypothetical protein